MKGNKHFPIYIALLIVLFVFVFIAMNPAHSDRRESKEPKVKANKSVLRLAQKLDLLPAGYRSDVKQFRRDILFSLTKSTSSPQEALQYLAKPAFYDVSETLLIPWCFEAAVEEKDDIKMMEYLYPILHSDSSFYRVPSTKKKLIELAQRVSKAKCDQDWQKLQKYKILEKMNRFFLGSSSPEKQLEIIDLTLAAAEDCSSEDYKRLLNTQKQQKDYISREKEAVKGQDPVAIAERKLDRSFNDRDLYDVLYRFTNAVSQSQIPAEEKLSKLIQRAEQTVQRELFRQAKLPAQEASKILKDNSNVNIDLQSRLLRCLAIISTSEGDIDQAKKLLGELKQIDKSEQTAGPTKFLEAKLALAEGKPKQAVELLKNIDQNPKPAPRFALYRHYNFSYEEKLVLASAYFDLKQYDKAIEILSGVGDGDSSLGSNLYPELKTLLALAYYKANQKDKAEVALEDSEKIYSSRFPSSRGGPRNEKFYADYPLTYSKSLIYRGDIADHLQDKLRANRYYCVASSILDINDLGNAPFARQLNSKIEKTKNFDTTDEYWLAKSHAIVRQLRCEENARDDYKSHLKYLQFVEKLDGEIVELETRLETMRKDPTASPKSLFSSIALLSRKYDYHFADQLSRNPEYLSEAKKLKLEMIDLFIKSDPKELKWSSHDVERAFNALQSIEFLISAKQFDEYFAKIIRNAEAYQDEDDDDYAEVVTNLINGKTDDADYEEQFLIAFPRNRSLSTREHLFKIWMDERKASKGSNSKMLRSVYSPMRLAYERAGKIEEAEKLEKQIYALENSTLPDKVRNKISHALFLLRNNRVDESVKAWKEAGAISNWQFPDNSGAGLKYLYQFYHSRHLDKEVNELLDTVVSKNPETLNKIFDPAMKDKIVGNSYRGMFAQSLPIVEKRIELSKKVPGSKDDQYWLNLRADLKKTIEKSKAPNRN